MSHNGTELINDKKYKVFTQVNQSQFKQLGTETADTCHSHNLSQGTNRKIQQGCGTKGYKPLKSYGKIVRHSIFF
jgi:hypothetical protein